MISIEISESKNVKSENLFGPMTEIMSMTEAMSRMCKARATNDDIVTWWALHDAIVDHEKRDAVTRREAINLIKIMQRLMPVTVVHQRKDALEYFSLGLKEVSKRDTIDGFVWCSATLPLDESEMCGACIADESSVPELIAMLEGAMNIES